MSADPQRPARQQPGWRVDPTPDGRGGGSRPPSQWSRLGWRLAVIAVLLFAVNYWVASRATQQHPRVRIPYSPTFLQQVKTGNVKQITSKGTAIQGEFDK